MKGATFFWSNDCQKVFEEVKFEMANGPLLVHFDATKQITMVCDASPYGVGCVLNVVINNEERPCMMMSSSLSSAENNYSQLHREALAIIAGVKKFHKYIYGLHVLVYTD